MDKRQKLIGRRFFFGFILLAVGVVMILERGGLLRWEIYDLLLSWKMLLVAIGAYIFISGSRGAGIVVMAFGTFFMLPDLFPNYHDIKRFFWPVILLILGLLFMLSPRKGRHRFDKGQFIDQDFKKHEASNDFFDELVIFGGREILIYTQNLLGGKSTAIFGGNEIDLRQCEISPSGCNIEVTTLFGANILKVPNDWTVINKVTTIFGGYSDLRIKDSGYAPNPAKTIVITGVCIFGGTEVRNFSKA
jgi:predicted membrane protein